MSEKMDKKNLIIKTGAIIKMQIKIKKIEDGKLPEYKTEGAAGADCYARLNKPVIVKARKHETIPLGFAVEIPEGYEMQIRPRSGLARKNGVKTVLGTIDSDYRGEVGAIMFNDTEEDFEIKNGDRIAQAVICPVITAEWCLTDKLSETERGEGGFGHTGINEEIKMSYPHKIEKFYEPFNNIDVEKVKSLIGNEVVIDNKIQGKLKAVFQQKSVIPSYYIEIQIKDGQNFCGLDFANFSFLEAFQRVTISGHRFGKEINIE